MKRFNKMTEMQMSSVNGGWFWMIPFAGLVLAAVGGAVFTLWDFASGVHTPSTQK